MKRLALMAMIWAAAALCSAGEPASAPDYVSSVLQTKAALAGTAVSGVSGPQQPKEMFGGFVFKPQGRDFQVEQNQFLEGVLQAIKAGGWTPDVSHRDPDGSVPRRAILSGRRGHDHLEVVLFFFPVQDAKIGVSYSQIIRDL